MTSNQTLSSKTCVTLFWSTYERVTDLEVKNNKNRLTTTWQPHQGFKANIAQIKMCLVYSHFLENTSYKDLNKAFLLVIKWTGYYQTGYTRWEILLENRQQVWPDTEFWWKKEYL